MKKIKKKHLGPAYLLALIFAVGTVINESCEDKKIKSDFEEASEHIVKNKTGEEYAYNVTDSCHVIVARYQEDDLIRDKFEVNLCDSLVIKRTQQRQTDLNKRERREARSNNQYPYKDLPAVRMTLFDKNLQKGLVHTADSVFHAQKFKVSKAKPS